MSLEVTSWEYGPVSWDDLSERVAAAYRAEVAALSEGLCPVHGRPLEAVPVPPGRIAGHCAPCGRFWGYNRDSERVGWWLDHDPWRPELADARVPEFMDWRPGP